MREVLLAFFGRVKCSFNAFHRKSRWQSGANLTSITPSILNNNRYSKINTYIYVIYGRLNYSEVKK